MYLGGVALVVFSAPDLWHLSLRLMSVVPDAIALKLNSSELLTKGVEPCSALLFGVPTTPRFSSHVVQHLLRKHNSKRFGKMTAFHIGIGTITPVTVWKIHLNPNGTIGVG